MNYAFLADEFLDFWETKQQEISQQGKVDIPEVRGIDSPEEFEAMVKHFISKGELPTWFGAHIAAVKDLSAAKIDQEPIGDEWLAFIDMDRQNRQLRRLAKMQTAYSWLLHKAKPEATLLLRFNIERYEWNQTERKALYWTLSQMAHLYLPGLDLFSPSENVMEYPTLKRLKAIFQANRPYRQCLWCGNNKDEKGKEFPVVKDQRSKRYCHVSHCHSIGDSNPTAHRECCYGKWRRIQTNLVDKRLKGYWEKQKGLSSEEIETEIKKIFRVFCEEQYISNLSRHIESIQTKMAHAKIQASIQDSDNRFNELLSEFNAFTQERYGLPFHEL